MEIISSRAIVLKLLDYRESDRLVTLFTLEHGRLSGIARGSRRSVKRFGGALELFAVLNVQIKLRNALSELTEADIVTIHSGIRGDLDRIAHAAYATELIASLTPEAMPNPRLFRLISAYLDHLDRNPATSSDRRFFEINLLNILGYRPSLDSCSRCGTVLRGGDGIPGRMVGTDLLCRLCGATGRAISPETLDLLAGSLATGCFGILQFLPAPLAEAGALLDSIIESHLDAPLRSLVFLREMGKLPGQ